MFILVLGAGVIGVSVADALARRGARVGVLDMRAPGRGASQASAGILAPYIEADEHHPLLALGTRSLDMYDDFVAGVVERSGQAVGYARTGTLDVAFDAEAVARLNGAGAFLHARGVRHEWIDGAALASFESAVAPSALGGLHIHAHGWVAVSPLVAALTQSARLNGAWFESPIEAVDVKPTAEGVEVRAGSRTYTADAVVVATGSWSSKVKIAGMRPLPVRPIRGQLLELAWPANRPQPTRVVWGPDCYVVPWSDGRVLVGATAEDVGFDERATVDGVGGLLKAVSTLLLDASSAAFNAVRVGLRPAMPDGLPAIGPLPGLPRVVAATGHFRNGILLAPLTADVVSRYLLDAEADAAIATTTPARFLATSN